MRNPIQAFEKIKENFILYIKTAFSTRYVDFEEERENLLHQDKVFARAPWVEPLPTYKSSNLKVDQIKDINLTSGELQTFKKIVSAGLVGDYPLYQHQHEMLTKAMSGKHCVITSGTGSGKTESFLLPLFAYLCKELNKWKEHDNEVNNKKWWADSSTVVNKGATNLTAKAKQRPNPKRPPAVRALLVYPMNALVEDQLSRLRKALDSDEVRQILRDEYNDNRIYFGRYNSTSPISGKLYKLDDDGSIINNKYKVQQLKKELKEIEDNNDALRKYISNNPDNLDSNEITNLKANFQRLDGAEMRTRFDMQDTPPDIMITNFSMLSIMLMRDIEDPIFEQTKDWLECATEFDKTLTPAQKEEERKARIFHIIIDELHLYRGGTGSEIAYIIRMLLHRIGLTPDSDQLRILASSASLDGEEGQAFLKDFFGTKQKEIEIIKGEQEVPAKENSVSLNEKVLIFEKIGQSSAEYELKLPQKEQQIKDASGLDAKLNELLNQKVDIIQYLLASQENIKARLYTAFELDGIIRAVPAFKNGSQDNTEQVKFISEVLFGQAHKENRQAIKGFFYALGLLEKYKIKHTYPRLRFHLFYRNIPGMWGELIPDSKIEKGQAPVGEIFTIPKISYNKHRTLELLYCENCGTLAYGGSRVQYKDDDLNPCTELIPVSPDIEGVPETSPATIVEKRKYKDFSVFCPGKYDKKIESPENAISNTSGLKLQWYDAWLNVSTGRLSIDDPKDKDQYIQGKWLRVMDGPVDIADSDHQAKIANKISALPHTCPHCEADYSHPKKKKQSPFRGFRTGFGKSSQILSKELFDLLPPGEDTKKLVAFSDSREDAAKLAKNIEEEHYRSLLKEVIVHNITETLQLENRIIEALKSNNTKSVNQYKANESDAFVKINQLYVLINAQAATPTQIAEYQSIQENIKSFETLVDIVTQKLLDFGINPGGPFKSLENFKSDSKYEPWYYFFGFEKKDYNKSIDNWKNAQETINAKIERNVAALIFGRLHYSFEASGLGHVTVSDNYALQMNAQTLRIDKTTLWQICNAFMRIWGDNYKHNRTDYLVTPYENYEALPKRRKSKKYIKKVAEKYGIDDRVLGNAVFDILEKNGHKGRLAMNNINIKIAKENTSYYECSKCGTIHLHPSAHTCVFCLSDLPKAPQGSAKELWNKSYLTARRNQPYNPFRLHTEELTGQTDNQLLRQRQFRNIFLNPKDKLTQQIDVLSVTTTLEVGVDIGALQAIFLANLPPQRFNYQQRVGRTGRRGQLYSFALTFARGRSHDEYYFENPLSITGDKPPQPFLSLNQERIFKRMLTKAVLRFAFKEMGTTQGSVHGEFGDIADFKEPELQKTIDTDLDGIIQGIFNGLRVGVNKNGQPAFEFEKLKDYIHSLPAEITKKLQEQSKTGGDLSEFLAEAGILPMAGMPTRIRNLIHGFKQQDKGKNSDYETLSIDRDLSMAIYEFAPGAQKTKDKGVIQAIGFTPDIREISKNYANGQKMQAKIMHKDAFTERKWMIQDEHTKLIKSMPFEKATRVNDEEKYSSSNPESKVFIGASPAAFRTDLKYPKDSNEDFDINISKPLTFAEATKTTEERAHNNYLIKYTEQGLTWKINNNGGDYFKGKYISHQTRGADLDKQWIASGFVGEVGQVQSQSEEEALALISGKVTEVFRLQPQNLNLCLDINPFDRKDQLNAAASKGAFYSAAFLLQRTLADTLDIDPEEIEIAAIDSIELPENAGVNGKKTASIVLSDELPNGSGFIQQLFEKFDTYLQKCITPTIKDQYNYAIVNNQDCQDASYSDLKNYRNMNFHPLLDWRLGVGLLRVMNDENYLSGLQKDDYKHLELKRWKEFVKELAEQMAGAFDNIVYQTFGQLQGFTLEGEHKVIITHPFWNWSPRQPAEELNILTEAIKEVGEEDLYFIDSFNLHRRPGWCYGLLIKQIIDNG